MSSPTRLKVMVATAALALVIVVTAGLWWRGKDQVRHVDKRQSPSSSPRSSLGHEGSLATDASGPAGNAALPAQPPSSDNEVQNVMDTWRAAILGHDAERVLLCDRIFREQAGLFIQALMKSAESDPEERVRAFSTRVIGKIKDPESTDLLRKLLHDRSRYVRENAAWALGQLGHKKRNDHVRP
jgi:hypothetical protein